MAIRNGRHPSRMMIQSSPDTKVRRVGCATRNVTDEAQYAVHKSLLPQISSFFHPEVQKEYEQQVDIWKENGKNPKEKPSNPFEKAAEDYIEQHTTDDPLEQFSDIGHTDEGIYYVTHPNIVSRTIIKAIDEVVQYHNLEVPLGIAWITGRNWKMCH